MDLFKICRIFFLRLNVDSDPDFLPQVADSHHSWPIGVGKKCCELCWLLHEAYNAQLKELGRFIVPGTHGTFYPWYPPPMIPHHILSSLHAIMLEESKTMMLTHSRQSSASSAISDLDMGIISVS